MRLRRLVSYDGKPVPFSLGSDKTATIPEPRAGQKVELELVRRDPSPVRYGVVVKVNGENTLFKERLPALQCRKWILDPGDKGVGIGGYRLDENRTEPFRIAAPAESTATAVNYGKDVGQISVVVFREALPGGPSLEALPPEETGETGPSGIPSVAAEQLLAATFGKTPEKTEPRKTERRRNRRTPEKTEQD